MAGGDPGAAGPGRRRAWTVLALLALVSATHQFHRLGLPSLASHVIRDEGFSEQDVGMLMGAFFNSYTACMVLGGWLADRIGTWWTLLLVVLGSGIFGGMIGAAGWLGLGAAGLWSAMYASRSAMGVCSAPLYPSTSRTVGAWFPAADQPWANGIVTAFATIGIAAASVLLSALAPSLGWRGALAASGAATSLVVLAWWALGPRRSPPLPAGSGATGFLRLLGHRGLIALTFGYAAVGYYEYTIMSWFKYYLSDVRRMSETESAWLNTIPNYAFTVCGICGGALSGWAIRRWGLRAGLRAVPMAGMALAAAFLVLGARSESTAGAVAAVSLGMGFIGACEGSFWTAAVRLGGGFGATAAGIMNTGGNIPGMIAPVLTPWIAAHIGGTRAADPGRAAPEGWAGALIVTAMVAMTGVVFWRFVDPEAGRGTAPTPDAQHGPPVS